MRFLFRFLRPLDQTRPGIGLGDDFVSSRGSSVRNTKGASVKKTCEACGAGFACWVSRNSCWCFEVQVSATILAEFRSRYTDCLCANCLARGRDATLANHAVG